MLLSFQTLNTLGDVHALALCSQFSATLEVYLDHESKFTFGENWILL